MSKGGGSTKSTTNTTAEPWSGLQPYLKSAYADAQNLYNSGGPEYYPNATYVPFTSQQDLAMQLMQQRALMGNPLNQQAQDYIGQGLSAGLPGMNNALFATNFAAMGGANNKPVSMADIGKVKTDYSAPTFAAQQIDPDFRAKQLAMQNGVLGNVASQLNKTAQGGYLNNNPYLDQTYDRAADAVTRNYQEAVMPSVNSTFSLAGRTGSNAHQGAVDQASDTLGRTLEGLGSSIYGQDYATERGRMQDAAAQLGGFQLQGQGLNQQAGMANQQAGLQTNNQNLTAMQANQNATNQARMSNQDARLTTRGMNQTGQLANQNLGMQLAGLNQAGNNANVANALQGANMLMNYGGQQQDYMGKLAAMAPGMANLDYGDMERLYGVGNQVQGQAQNVLNDSMNRFNFYQNRPEQNMNQYTAWLNGIPGSNFGTTQSSTSGGGGSTLGNAVGGGLLGMAATPFANSALSAGLSGMGVGGAMGATATLAPWLLPALGIGSALFG